MCARTQTDRMYTHIASLKRREMLSQPKNWSLNHPKQQGLREIPLHNCLSPSPSCTSSNHTQACILPLHSPKHTYTHTDTRAPFFIKHSHSVKKTWLSSAPASTSTVDLWWLHLWEYLSFSYTSLKTSTTIQRHTHIYIHTHSLHKNRNTLLVID